MAQILIRDLDEDTVRKLKRRAERAGRSLEAEVKKILEWEGGEPELDMGRLDKMLAELRRPCDGRKSADNVPPEGKHDS